MAAVMIKCPKTGKPVHTGLDMSKESFEKSSLSGNSVTCQHCNGTHKWDKKDAYVAAE